MNKSTVSINIDNDSKSSSSSNQFTTTNKQFIIVNTRLATSFIHQSQFNKSLYNSSFQFNRIKKSKVQKSYQKHEQLQKSTLYARIIFLLNQITDDHDAINNFLSIYHKIDTQTVLTIKQSSQFNNNNNTQEQNQNYLQNISQQINENTKMDLKCKISQWANKKVKKVKILQDSYQCQSQQYIQSNNSNHHKNSSQQEQNNKQNIKNVSNDDHIVEKSISQESINQKLKSIKMINKNVSIVLQDQNLKCSLFSNQSQCSSHFLKNMIFPEIIMNQEYMQKIYGDQSFFFVNLSLCILSKYIIRSSYRQKKMMPYLLGISVIIAYKIFYDQPIGGLIEYYSEMLGCESDKLIEMERQVLNVLNYQLVISNKHYYWMMTNLIPQ